MDRKAGEGVGRIGVDAEAGQDVERERVAMKVIMVLMLLVLAGCSRQRLGLDLNDPDVYTRADVDAINAESECKAIARTPLQMSRCVIPRR